MKTLIIAAFLFTSNAFAFSGNPADVAGNLQFPSKNFNSNVALKKVSNRCNIATQQGDYGTVSKVNKYKVYSVYDAQGNFVGAYQTKNLGFSGLCVRPAQ